MPTNKPLEKSIENVLRKAVEAEGGLCLKWVCPGHRGVPDRMILFPGGIIAFVELKRPGAKVKAGGLQEWWREKIQSFGFPCHEVNDKYQAQQLAADPILCRAFPAKRTNFNVFFFPESQPPV